MSLSGLSSNAGAIQRTPQPALQREIEQANTADKLEGMFVSVLIKAMRQTIDGDGFFPGDSSDVLGGMFDQYMGDHIAKNSNFGLASLMNATVSDKQDDSKSEIATQADLHPVASHPAKEIQ